MRQTSQTAVLAVPETREIDLFVQNPDSHLHCRYGGGSAVSFVRGYQKYLLNLGITHSICYNRSQLLVSDSMAVKAYARQVCEERERRASKVSEVFCMHAVEFLLTSC